MTITPETAAKLAENQSREIPRAFLKWMRCHYKVTIQRAEFATPANQPADEHILDDFIRDMELPEDGPGKTHPAEERAARADENFRNAHDLYLEKDGEANALRWAFETLAATLATS